MENDQVKSRWHFVREVPLAVMLALAGQTVGLAYWAGQQALRIESAEKALAAAIAVQAIRDVKQDSDADRIEQRIMSRLDGLGAKIDRMAESRVERR
jgi:hypothetical protein